MPQMATSVGQKAQLGAKPTLRGQGAAALGLTGYASEVGADAPYRYWMDWTNAPVPDATGSGGDLTLAATMNQVGPLTAGDSKAGLFNGTTHRGSSALVLNDTNKLTIEFWLWWDAFANGDNMAMEYTPSASVNQGFFIDPNAANGFFQLLHAGDSGNNIQNWTRPSAAAWHHYAFVIDCSDTGANEVTGYLDGSLWVPASNSGLADNNANFPNDTLNVMCRNQASLFGAGRMAQLAIYKKALSAARVAAHWGAR